MGTVRTSVTAGVFGLEGVPIYFNEIYTSTATVDVSLTNAEKNTEKNTENQGSIDNDNLINTLLLSQTRAHYSPSDFRPSNGNQIVANVYTLSNIINQINSTNDIDKINKINIVKDMDGIDGENVSKSSTYTNEISAVITTESAENVNDSCSIPESYVSEIAVREGNLKTRVRYAYTNKISHAITTDEIENNIYDIYLLGFIVIRECITGNLLLNTCIR